MADTIPDGGLFGWLAPDLMVVKLDGWYLT
jgi:hypothetical protein